MSRLKLALLGLLVIAFTGCGKTNKETEQKQPPAAQQPAVQPVPPAPVPESTPVVSEPAPVKPEHVKPAQHAKRMTVEKKAKAEKPTRESSVAQQAQTSEQNSPEVAPATTVAPRQELPPPEPPKAREPRFATIPSGTSIQVRLQDPLDTSVNRSGDSFRAILDQDIEIDGVIVAPRGSILQGKLSNVAQSGRVEGRAAISMHLVTLSLSSQTYPIQTDILSFEAESTKKKDAAKVGLGAGIGAVIGAIAGGGKGAAIGAAVGGGAGGATVIATRGKELRFDPEHKLNFSLSRDVRIRVQ